MLNEPNQQDGRLDEPEELRLLTKSQLHKLLCTQFLLPAKECRAMTRQYLVKVHRGEVLRVDRMEILTFEAALTQEQMARIGSNNVTILVQRITLFLDQQALQPFGFLPGCYPEEGWIYRVARFLDRANVLGIFRLPIPDTPLPRIQASRM